MERIPSLWQPSHGEIVPEVAEFREAFSGPARPPAATELSNQVRNPDQEDTPSTRAFRCRLVRGLVEYPSDRSDYSDPLVKLARPLALSSPPVKVPLNRPVWSRDAMACSRRKFKKEDRHSLRSQKESSLAICSICVMFAITSVVRFRLSAKASTRSSFSNSSTRSSVHGHSVMVASMSVVPELLNHALCE